MQLIHWVPFFLGLSDYKVIQCGLVQVTADSNEPFNVSASVGWLSFRRTASEKKYAKGKKELIMQKEQKCIKISEWRKLKIFPMKVFPLPFLLTPFLREVRERNSLMKLFICSNFHLYANWRIFPFDWKIGLWLSSCYFDLLWNFSSASVAKRIAPSFLLENFAFFLGWQMRKRAKTGFKFMQK